MFATLDTVSRSLSNVSAVSSGRRCCTQPRASAQKPSRPRRGGGPTPATPRAEVLISPPTTVAPPNDAQQQQRREGGATKTVQSSAAGANQTRQRQHRRRPHGDLNAGPPLDDAEYGEHAAAFLSGNFQPLIQESTATLVIRPAAPAAQDASEAEGNDDGEAGSSSTSTPPGGDNMYMVGDIPSDFPDGKFVYVGPNPKFPREHYKVWGEGPGQVYPGFANGWHHWFEGDGMVYAVDFEGAAGAAAAAGASASVGAGARRVQYRNRFVRTNSWHDELRHGSRLFRPLMNTSGVSFLPHAVANLFSGGNFLKDSANTALTSFAGRLLALQDTMPPWELDGDTLETKGSCDFDGKLPFYVPFTAHPKVAPGTGELMFFGFNPVYPPHCSVGSLDPQGVMGPITSLWHNAFQGATFMHDFCVTQNYTVLFEGSMNIRPLRMLKGDHPLQYDGSQRARFGLMRRGGGGGGGGEGAGAADAGADAERSVKEEVVWCDCGAAEMVYHFVNAWEEENDAGRPEIVVVGVREDGFFHGALAANGTRDWIRGVLEEGKAVPRMHEWRIDPASGAVTSERWLFDDVVEVPRINDAFTGVKNRFSYAGRVHTASLADDAQLKFDAVVKFDMHTGETHVYQHGEGRYGMEAQFVPRDAGRAGSEGVGGCGGEAFVEAAVEAAVAEDDGWLVLYVHDESATGKDGAAEGRSECVVLDAKNIEAGPVARIVLPSRVPYGAHALWCPSDEEAAASVVASTESQRAGAGAGAGDGLGRGGRISSTSGGGGDGLVAERGGAAAAAAAAIKASPPEPRAFAFVEGQVGALLGAVRTGALRAAAGLFVNGWRPWVGLDAADEYAFVRAFGVRFTEARALGTVREEQARQELAEEISAEAEAAKAKAKAEAGAGAGMGAEAGTGAADSRRGRQLATPTLTLYELEGCGASRRVREAICMLDLACTMKPCPHGAVRNRMAAAAAQTPAKEGSAAAASAAAAPRWTGATFCADDAELPYLEDARTGVTLTGADAIVEYLYEEYLDGAAPSPLVAPGPFAAARAQLAVNARGGEDSSPSTAAGGGRLGRGPAGAFYSRPTLAPRRPLELWAYEASPFCAVVREALSEMEITYVMRPCARGSPRRTQLMRRTGGTFQVPYLEDPNTGVAMFESDEIVRYLRSTYLP